MLITQADAEALLAQQAELLHGLTLPGSRRLDAIALTAVLPPSDALTELAAITPAPLPAGQRIYVCGSAHEGSELYRAPHRAARCAAARR